MKSILKVEFFRLKKSAAFWVCFGLCAGLPILSLLLVSLLNLLLAGMGQMDMIWRQYASEGGAFLFLSQFTPFSSDCNILALICTTIVLCSEFKNGTVRNIVMANKSRTQIFLSYFVISLVIGVIYLLTEFTVTLTVFGSVVGFGNLAATKVFTNILLFLAMGISSLVCVQTMVCMFMFTTKRTSLTILFPLLISLLLPGIISQIVEAVISAAQGAPIPQNVLYFIPFSNWQVDTLTPSGLNVGMVILYNLILSAVFFVSGFFPFKKADLK